MSTSIPRTLKDWKASAKKDNGYCPTDRYYAIETQNHDFCLALMIQSNLPHKKRRIFHKESNKLQRRNQSLIQIGNILDGIVPTNCQAGDSPNIILIDSNQLIKLPLPISLFSIQNKCKKNDDKWIITKRIFEETRILCMNSIYYAKHGDWKSFTTEFLHCKKVCLFVCQSFSEQP